MIAKSHCTYTIASRVVKSLRVVCETFARSIIVLSYENNDIRESRTFTRNLNHLMGTITFKVHHITLTSP